MRSSTLPVIRQAYRSTRISSPPRRRSTCTGRNGRPRRVGSDRGIPLEETSRLVGSSVTAVTEEVYRKQIRLVIQTVAVAMYGIFGTEPQRP